MEEDDKTLAQEIGDILAEVLRTELSKLNIPTEFAVELKNAPTMPEIPPVDLSGVEKAIKDALAAFSKQKEITIPEQDFSKLEMILESVADRLSKLEMPDNGDLVEAITTALNREPEEISFQPVTEAINELKTTLENKSFSGGIGPSKKFVMDKSGRAINPSMAGETSSKNTTTTLLASGGTYTGTGEQNNHPHVGVYCFSDVSGTLYFDWSVDGTNWHQFPTAGFAVAASVPEFHTAVKLPRYFRVRFVMDAGTQTAFRLTTYYGSDFVPSVSPLNASISTDQDALVTKAVIIGQNAGGSYKNVPTSNGGLLGVDVPRTAFGELMAESKTPQVQLKFPYGQVLDLAQELTNNASSTVTYADGNAIVTCAGAANAFSQIRSVDTIRYGPGQGSQFLGTCAFTTGVANSSQVFGPGDDDEGFFFGYNGTSFGVLRRSGGSLEIKTLTITGAADAGGGDFTITLDGDPVTVTVGASATISQVVAAIVAASDDFFNAGRGWEVYTPDNVSVQFISLVAENAAGSFSFADVDSGVTASAFTESVAGVAPTENWVAQANWNIDPMDGTGPSGMTLDPTKGNVYQIKWQYLGYGEITFSIENPTTGKFQNVHRIQYANNNTTPTLVNPTLHCNLIAKTETGYSGGALVMKTASLAGFIEGQENPEGIRRSISVEKSMSTTENVLLILENDFVFKSLKNKVTVYPDFMAFGSESTKTTILRLYRMPTGITGGVALTNIETDVSVMKYGSTGTTFTGGSRVLTMVFNNSGERDLGKVNLKIRPGERYLLTGQLSSGAASLVNVSATWVERI